MAAGTFDDRYLDWLYGQVVEVRPREPFRTYWTLLTQLYRIEFTWFVPNDDNRAADGLELRREWMAEFGIESDRDWFELGCSFLELLVGLSRRLAFETEAPPDYWFWHLLDNLGFLEFNDANNDYKGEFVNRRVKAVIDRKYAYNGQGGLFPLEHCSKDQRTVELWYQLSAYLLESA
jgi:hypothetical protein